jgi:hypothetical protein
LRRRGRQLARLPWTAVPGAYRPIEEVPAYEEVDIETAEDAFVCQRCMDIAEDGPYPLDKAENLVPVHVWCRCAFVPSGRGSVHEFDSDQTDAQALGMLVSQTSSEGEEKRKKKKKIEDYSPGQLRGKTTEASTPGSFAPAEATKEEQPAFHGTTRPIEKFSQLGEPEETFNPDRMLGYHFAKDPAVSNAFVMERINEEERGAQESGHIIPVLIPGDQHMLEVPQPQYEWAAKKGLPRTNNNIETDEVAIAKMIAREAYPSHPEILAKFLENRHMSPDEAKTAAKTIVEGGTAHLPLDGPHNLERLVNNFIGAFPTDVGLKRQLVRTAREHWQKQGYKGLKYINTSPMETMATAGVKDPTSFVVFNPKHVRGRYTGDQVGFKFTFTTDAIWWDDEPGHPFRGNQYVRVQSALKPEAQRAFEGEQVPSKTKLTKLQKDEVGEQIMFRLMEKLGLKNPQSLNEHYGVNNYPLDLAGDHLAIELKTGDASNGPSGQQWNTKIGQMGPAEQAKYDKMSPEKRRIHNDKKMKDIIKRKYQALARLRKETGVDYKPWTFGLILDTDRKVADIHAVPGYHPRIGYKQKEAQDGYVTTVKYK